MKHFIIIIIILVLMVFMCSARKPMAIYSISWEQNGKLRLFGKYMGDGGLILPDVFEVDSGGNVYIYDPFNSRIQVFGDKGNFIKSIHNTTELKWSIERIEVLDDDTLFIFSNSRNGGIIVINQEGDLLLEEKVDNNKKKLGELKEYIIKNNKIYYKSNDRVKKISKNEKIKKVMVEEVTGDIRRSDVLTKVDQELVRTVKDKFLIDDGNEMVTKNFHVLKRLTNEAVRKEKSSGTRSDSDDELYRLSDLDEKKITITPCWFGFDDHNNSYWYYGEMKYTVLIYSANGMLIRSFELLPVSDLPMRISPVVDDSGNVYVMQVWEKDGIKIWKYERDW